MAFRGEIIKMIDYRCQQTEMTLGSEEPMEHALREYFSGKVHAYEELSHHLQSFIEGQLNAAENQTGE